MSTGMKRFRTSVNGYKKEDVNEYIQNENRRFSEIEKEHLDKIDELLDKLDELQTQLSVAKEKLARAEDEIATLEAENKSLKNDFSVINNMNTELVEVNDKITNDSLELSKNNAALIKENSDLQQALEELKAVADERPAEPSITEKGQISDMIYRARNASEDMLKRAEEGAAIILGKAKDEVNTCRSEAVYAVKEIFDAATEELRRSIGICMNDFASALKKAKNDPSRADDAADFCDDDLGRRIERMQNDLDRAIAEKLAEFDCKK